MQCSAGRGVFVVCIVCAYVSVLSHLFVNIMTGCRTKIKESCKNYLCISFITLNTKSASQTLTR